MCRLFDYLRAYAKYTVGFGFLRSAPSRCAHRKPPGELLQLNVLLITQFNYIKRILRFCNSRLHFYNTHLFNWFGCLKSSCFLGERKENTVKERKVRRMECGCGTQIIVLPRLLCFHNHWKPLLKLKKSTTINFTALPVRHKRA